MVARQSKKLESGFQKELMDDIRKMFPGCIIQKLDPKYQQGIPDWLILFEDRWAVLEAKRGIDEPAQPNQEWFIERMNSMSFGAFVYPENKEEVLHALQSALQPRRKARVAKREQVPVVELHTRSAA